MITEVVFFMLLISVQCITSAMNQSVFIFDSWCIADVTLLCTAVVQFKHSIFSLAC